MALVIVLDGLSQHSCLNPALAFQTRTGFRHLYIILSSVVTYFISDINILIQPVNGHYRLQAMAYIATYSHHNVYIAITGFIPWNI